MTSQQKHILVIGATGAQGLAVVDALLAPSEDGTPSPYTVRALTRNARGTRAQELAAKGVELFEGSFTNFEDVKKALTGVYGVWNNTDGFTIPITQEIQAGIRIFEIAKTLGTVKHYIWSNLDYTLKKANWNPEFRCEHYDAKGIVADWMQAQPSELGDGMTWNIVTSGPYMDMLNMFQFGPVAKTDDDTYVFAAPIGKGHIPMIALSDLGFWARYSFDNRESVSSKDLEIASHMASAEDIVESFKKVTGKKAIRIDLEVEEFFTIFNNPDIPVSALGEKGSTTFRQNFTAWWKLYRHDILKRDMDWIRKIHPKTRTVETWMREINYTGDGGARLLKSMDSAGEHYNDLGIVRERVLEFVARA